MPSGILQHQRKRRTSPKLGTCKMALGVTTSETTGLPYVVLMHPNGAKAEVQLHGATVTSFKTSQGREVLFLSKKAVFNGVKAIRGGIPLVFPQFGQPDKAMPSHGVARISTWRLSEEEPPAEDGHVKVQSNVKFHNRCLVTGRDAYFLLDHSADTMAKWPHPFNLRYEVDLGADELSVTLHVTNPGKDAFDFKALLHTYLSVAEISEVKVEGFQNVGYVDQIPRNPFNSLKYSGKTTFYTAEWGQVARSLELKEHASFTDERPQAVFAEEVDRIYSGEIGDINIVGGTKVSNSCVKKEGETESCVPVDVVFWNPWIAKSQALADFDDEDYHNMVCIEPGIVSKFHTIAPGVTFALKQAIIPSP